MEAQTEIQTYLEQGRKALAAGQGREAAIAYAHGAQLEPDNPEVHLGLVMVTSTLFAIYSILNLLRMLRTVQNEIKPLLASVQETVGIVKTTAQTAGRTVSTLGETAKLTSEWALAPAIGTVASVVAAGGMIRSFFGKGHARTRAERRRQEQATAVRASKEASARGVK